MARKHLLEGLMKWTTREPWRDRFEAGLEDHVLPTCDETGLEFGDIVETLGEYQTSEELINGLRSIGKLTPKEKRELAKAIGEDFDAAVITNLSETERLRAVSATFTTCWLLDAIDRAEQRKCPICATPTAMS